MLRTVIYYKNLNCNCLVWTKILNKKHCISQTYQVHILLFLRFIVLQNTLQIFHSDTSSSATDRVTNMLLQEMDGLSSGNDVIVLGATNQPQVIDDVIICILHMLNISLLLCFIKTNKVFYWTQICFNNFLHCVTIEIKKVFNLYSLIIASEIS